MDPKSTSPTAKDQPVPERMDDEERGVTEPTSGLSLHMKVHYRAARAADRNKKKVCSELDVIAPEPSERWFPL